MPKYRVQYFTKKANGKTYRHPWLGYRQRNQNGTPTFVAVVSLVGMPDEVVKALDRSLKLGGGEAGEVRFLDSENIGAAWVAWRIGERLGIWEVLSRLEEPYQRMVTVMVLDRVLAERPSSKLDLWERMKTDKAVLGKVAGLPEGRPLAEWYTALNKLLAAQSAMELELFERRNGSAELLFLYDIMSSSFEGEHYPMADDGYNRDGKKGKKQIVIGLLTDHGGMPVSVEVFQGNTSDKTTVLDQVRQVRDRFGVKELVFVGDRGMLTSSSRVDLTADKFAGLHYVSALPQAELAELVESAFRAMKTTDLFLRPLRHWNPTRVRGSVFLCLLSYMITLEARRLFTDFLAPVQKPEDAEIFRASLARLWATLNTVKTGKLSMAGKETVQVSPITNEVRALLKAADAAIGKEAKERFGVSL